SSSSSSSSSIRFRRPLPFLFLLLAVLIFIGGALYPPSNHTALSYRTPRVLNWLAEGHWYWIHTDNYRMNDRACGIEWLSAPLLLFTKSDRTIFLLNWFPFLLLPGLIFSVCRHLGVKGRVAWCWMWLLPTGYSFLLQAGSAGNDTFPTVYALAAIDFACRAWNPNEPSRVQNLWYSGLAAALLVGAKASNLPLLLPWAVVSGPLISLLKKRPIISTAIIMVALLVSFLPTALLNIHYCHDWSGLNLEHKGMEMKNPIVGIWGNMFIFLLDNFVPPFFPLAGWWNKHALTFLPQAIVAPMAANFEADWQFLGELPTEDWSGIGFGISLLLLISVLARFRFLSSSFSFSLAAPKSDVGGSSIRSMQRWRFSSLPPMIRRLALLTPWLSLLAYCMKSGMVTGARLISPYYPLLLPALLCLPGQSEIVHRRWWKILAYGVVLLAFPVLVLTPGRPLWPAQTVLSRLCASHPNNHALSRALAVYQVYSTRHDPLAKVRELLPPDLKVVGFMGEGDDIDISFWRPFGSREVKHVLVEDSPKEIRARGIQYLVAGNSNFGRRGITLDAWLARTGAQVIASTTATIRVADGPREWYVVKMPN
ncbi:MAG TPA: hypothetical protein VLT36_23950, partial [Candidatus Dormibacteraeota bacterium]|nr:hypothetical protein [Candidatus Dormibacteraeota bacterium]